MKFFESLRALAAGDGLKRRPREVAVAAEISSIANALAQADAEDAAAKSRLATAQQRYDELLLADASYEEKQQHKREVEEAEDLVRALPLFKRQQERRLADLKKELRDLNAMAQRRIVDDANAEYLTAMRGAVTSWTALVRAREAAIKAGFGNELAGWGPLPLPIDLSEHVRVFEQEAARTSLAAPGHSPRAPASKESPQ